MPDRTNHRRTLCCSWCHQTDLNSRMCGDERPQHSLQLGFPDLCYALLYPGAPIGRRVAAAMGHQVLLLLFDGAYRARLLPLWVASK
jgi:hypothetical protein